jgi:hypothetical protein
MRTSILVTAVAAVLFNVPLAAQPADSFPKFDIAKNCKLEVSENSGVGETLESCTHDEEQARQELMPQWNDYSKQDRNICLRETSIDGTPSYVELQTCLEIADDKPRLKAKK